MSVKTFALFIGIVYVVAGIGGFIPALMGPVPADAPPVGIDSFYGMLLGLFPANFLHHLVHIALGAWGVAAARTVSGARSYSRSLAVIFGVLAVMGLFPTLNTTFGLIPLYGHDVWLHGGTAVVAALFGWVLKDSTTATRTA